MKRSVLAIAALLFAIACVHSGPGPSNEYAWSGGWTNLVPVNHTGQTFKAASPIVRSIDLDLLTGNPGRAASDTLTLSLFEGATLLGTSSVTLRDGADGWTRFTFRPPVHVRPDSTIKMELADSGAVLFGWRYGGDNYPDGVAILLGVENPAYDFRFRVNAP